MQKTLIALAVSLLAPLHANALGLLEGFQLARQNDPQYRMAAASRNEGALLPSISRAQMLPNVSASASRFKVTGTLTSPNILGKMSDTPLDYFSESRQLQLRQSVFNAYKFLDYKQSKVRADQSQSEFAIEQNRFISRYLTAYTDVQLQQQNVRFSQALVTSLGEALRFAQRQQKLGESSIIDVTDAEAKLAVAESRLIEAEGALRQAEQALSIMLGQPVQGISKLGNGVQRVLVVQDSYEQLLAKVAASPEVQRSQQAVDVAALELKKAKSNHLPTLDLIVSKSYSLSESISTRNQQTRQNMIGLQVSVPLFAGGQVYYQSEAMGIRLDRAVAEQDNVRQQVQLELAKSYSGLQTNLRKIDAYNKSLKAAETLVKASRKGVEVGVRTIVDLLDAEERLYTERRNLVDAQNQSLLNWVRLKSLQGELQFEDVAALDKWFTEK